MTRLFCIFALLLLVSCESKSTHPLYGSWKIISTSGDEVVLTFHPQLTFEMDLDGKKGKDIWGTYSLEESQITFQNSGGGFAPPCAEPGVYEYQIRVDQLTFIQVNDQCQSRIEKMKEIWTKEEPFLGIVKRRQPQLDLKS